MTDAQEDRIMAAISAATQKIMDALAGSAHKPSNRPGGASGGARPSAGTFRFGRQKGEALSSGTPDNLEWYRTAIQQSIADPSKDRYLDDNRKHLEEVEAAMDIESSAPPMFGGSGAADDDIPFAKIDGRIP